MTTMTVTVSAEVVFLIVLTDGAVWAQITHQSTVVAAASVSASIAAAVSDEKEVVEKKTQITKHTTINNQQSKHKTHTTCTHIICTQHNSQTTHAPHKKLKKRKNTKCA